MVVSRGEHLARKLTSGDWNDRDPQWPPDGQTVVFLSDRGRGRGKSCAVCLLRFSGEGEPGAITAAKSQQEVMKMQTQFGWVCRPSFCPLLLKQAAVEAREEGNDIRA